MTFSPDIATPMDGVRIAVGSAPPAIGKADDDGSRGEFRLKLRETGHGLLRELLCLPRSALIERDAFGAPRIGAQDTWNISMSYSGSHVFVAAAHSRIGIDAEKTAAAGELLEGLAHYCHPAEIAGLEHLQEAGRRQAALDLWTAKEAFVKCAGVGFRIDPRAIRATGRTECGAIKMTGAGLTARIVHLRAGQRHPGREAHHPACVPPDVLLALATEDRA